MHTFFQTRVTVADNGCWNWRGSVNKWGYGRTKTPLCAERASHRISYVLHCGAIPESRIILHSCDNPRCCNPEHLSLGSHADNVADMVRKGRNAVRRGSKCGTAKLDDEMVRVIKRDLAAGVAIRQLAQRFSVSYSTVWLIKRGATWN